MKRKYGKDIEEILKYKEEVENKINNIENVDEINKKLRERLEILVSNMNTMSIKMHEIRIKKAKELESKVNECLENLEMKNAILKIDIVFNESNEFNERGLDKIKFLISTNKGEGFKSMTKIASGGEISRIVLAIKSVLSESDKVESCVFDEIDTGISGKAAISVGEKIKKIAKNHQVICITHLAQVAAYADAHYYISKEVEEERTKTSVKELEENDKINELARISSGNISDIAIKYALELIKISKKVA